MDHNENNINLDEVEQLLAECNGNKATETPPITLLQEICSRNGLVPEYQLLSTEGSVHEPTFKIAVTVADITVTASGQSKKKARHAAAREAIVQLRQKPNLDMKGINFNSMPLLPTEPTTKSDYEIASNEANPVGKLQEICMKMRVNPPDYDTCDEKGLAHEKIFYLSCTIVSLNMTTLGQGRSKKLAKRQAAEFMLAKLESSEIYDKSTNSKETTGESSSLNMDVDDNSHFVRSKIHVNNIVNLFDRTPQDIWEDIQMIETDNAREDFFYEMINETVKQINHKCQWNFLTECHCVLQILDFEGNIKLSSLGVGTGNVSAMKNSVINAYKLLLSLQNPLAGTEPSMRHRLADRLSNPQAT